VTVESDLDTRVVRGSGWVAIGYGTRSVLSMLSMLVLVRLLDPKAFGLVALASIFVVALEQIQGTGVWAALVYRRQEIDRAAATALVFTSASGIALWGAVAASAPLYAWAFHAPALTDVLRVMALLLVFRGLGVAPAALLERAFDFRALAIAELATAVAQIAVSTALALTGFGVWSLVFGQLAGAGAGTALCWVYVPFRPSPRRASWRLLRELLRYGRFVSAGNIIGLFNGTVDNMVIGRLLGTRALGFYSVTFRLADFPTSVVGYVVSRVMLPAYAALQDDRERFRAAYVQTLQRIALLSLPLGVTLGVAADPIVRGLLGDQWLPGVTALRILAAYSIIRSFAGCSGPAFQALGKPHLVLLWSLPQTFVTVPLLVLLVPHYGINGAALAMVIGFSASGVPAFVSMARELRLGVPDLAVALGPSVLCSVLLGLTLAFMIGASGDLSPVASLTVVAAAGLAVYVAAAAVFARGALTPVWTALRGRAA
jgi:O-antigen/teichoic acid export membrane protein